MSTGLLELIREICQLTGLLLLQWQIVRLSKAMAAVAGRR